MYSLSKVTFYEIKKNKKTIFSCYVVLVFHKCVEEQWVREAVTGKTCALKINFAIQFTCWYELNAYLCDYGVV